MKIAFFVYTYEKEFDLVKGLYRRVKSALHDIDPNDVSLTIVNDGNASLSEDEINSLIEDNVDVITSTVDRKGNLRGMEFIQYSLDLMASHKDCDIVIKIDPDIGIYDVPGIIAPIIQGKDANFVKYSNKVCHYGMGLCYAMRRDFCQTLAERFNKICPITFNAAILYACCALGSSINKMNFPVREDMMISLEADAVGNVAHDILCFYHRRGPRTPGKYHVMLINPTLMKTNKEEAARLLGI